MLRKPGRRQGGSAPTLDPPGVNAEKNPFWQAGGDLGACDTQQLRSW